MRAYARNFLTSVKTALPVFRIDSIALISLCRKDEPRILTAEDVERTKKRLETVALEGKGHSFSTEILFRLS